jgi:hypothetical protein
MSGSALKNFFAILLAAVLYFVLSYIRIPVLEKDASFFVDWLVVFLHEFGHALAAELTGGDATQVVIFPDIPGVAGYACTAGGIRPVVQMGGYIGSAIFGAFFIFAALHRTRIFSQYGLRIIAIMLVLSQILWFPSGACGDFHAGLRDTAVSLSFCFAGAFLFWKMNSLPFGLKKGILLFLGTSSLCQIILDINGGPSSDLQNFTESMSVMGLTLIPLIVWKIIWFLIVLLIALTTIKLACRGENEDRRQD